GRRELAGRASGELGRAEAGMALQLRSSGASFALYRDVIVDLKEFPLLTWSWKVVRLPAAGDVRQSATDDEAAQVYVVFPRWPAPLTSSDVVGYVWDSRAPVGTQLSNPKAANVRIIVVESGAARLGTWQRHRRNVAADYVALFGRQPPRAVGRGPSPGAPARGRGRSARTARTRHRPSPWRLERRGRRPCPFPPLLPPRSQHKTRR